MATPSEKLAESLEALKELQDRGIMAIKASELIRVHRERLSKNGFLSDVMKGWYLSVHQTNNREIALLGMHHIGTFVQDIYLIDMLKHIAFLRNNHCKYILEIGLFLNN